MYLGCVAGSHWLQMLSGFSCSESVQVFLSTRNSMSKCSLGAKQSCGVTLFQQMVHYSARWRLLQHTLVFMPPAADYCCHRKKVCSTNFHLYLSLPSWLLHSAAWQTGAMRNKSNNGTRTHTENGKQKPGPDKGSYAVIIYRSLCGFFSFSSVVVKAAVRSGLDQ